MIKTLVLLQSQQPWLLILLFSIFSLCVGSFLNLLIYRLPMMLEKKSSLNLWHPRSFCPQCKTPLPFYRNIPLVTYMIQRGHCAFCQNPIGFQYLLVEALTLILSIMAFFIWGISVKLFFGLIIVWMLIALTFIDLKTYLLPDSLTLGLLWVGLLANSFNLFCPLSYSVYAASFGYLSTWAFINLYYLITKKWGMGYGDFKLIAALGACFGPSALPLILFISALSGVVGGFIMLKLKKQDTSYPIPFGPFLCFSGFIMLFFGDAVMRHYHHVLGL